MFKNYLNTALRNLLPHKANAFINIAGVTVGTQQQNLEAYAGSTKHKKLKGATQQKLN